MNPATPQGDKNPFMNITVPPNTPPMKPPKNTPIVNVRIEVNSMFPIRGESCIATHKEANMMNMAS